VSKIVPAMEEDSFKKFFEEFSKLKKYKQFHQVFEYVEQKAFQSI